MRYRTASPFLRLGEAAHRGWEIFSGGVLGVWGPCGPGTQGQVACHTTIIEMTMGYTSSEYEVTWVIKHLL